MVVDRGMVNLLPQLSKRRLRGRSEPLVTDLFGVALRQARVGFWVKKTLASFAKSSQAVLGNTQFGGGTPYDFGSSLENIAH